MALDQRLLRIAVANDPEVQRVLISQVRPAIKEAFTERKEEFMKAFDDDPVTKEIEAGPRTSSHLPELAETGGNLFSLLGFYAEQQPIGLLREYLRDNVVLYKTRAGVAKGDQIVFATDVLAPTVSEVNDVMASQDETKLEWTARSFTELLARGISGLPKYLFSLTRDFSRVPSRSGPAIQVKTDLRSTDLGPVPYISTLLGKLTQIVSPK